MIIKFLPSEAREKEPSGSHDPSTIPRESSPAAAELADPVSTCDSGCIVAADLSEDDYRSARMMAPEFSAFEDYEDWLDFRTGMLWGMEMAGFTVNRVQVSMAEFAVWCATMSILPSISALDRFARSRGPVTADEKGVLRQQS